MPYTGTISVSALIQDIAPVVPVTIASDSKSDQLASQSEAAELAVTVPASAVDQLIDLVTMGFKAKQLYITSDQPITMKQGVSVFAQPIRSFFVATYAFADAPASLKFSNAGSVDANVKIILVSHSS